MNLFGSVKVTVYGGARDLQQKLNTLLTPLNSPLNLSCGLLFYNPLRTISILMLQSPLTLCNAVCSVLEKTNERIKAKRSI